MALAHKDRVKESSTTTGTGNFTLAGAPSLYKTFASQYSTGTNNKFNYCIQNQGADEWEIGIGYISAATTLVRSTVISNSLGNTTLISFTAGTKDVFVTVPAVALPSSSTGSPYNTILGGNSGIGITTGAYNTMIGVGAGQGLSTGSSNTFVGYNTGNFNNAASSNVCIGYSAGYQVKGDQNIFIGSNCGGNTTVATNGIVSIGYLSGSGGGVAGNNTFVGTNSGQANTSGTPNAFFGYQSGKTNTTGSNNVFLGPSAGFYNVTGSANVFVGSSACTSSTASYNTAVGTYSGFSNTSGNTNSYFGYYSGSANLIGNYNTYLGAYSGYAAVGSNNTCIGVNSGYGAAGSSYTNVTCLGYLSGRNLTSGSDNTLIGLEAGYSTTTGGSNAVVGRTAFYTNTTGANNTAVGYYALFNSTFNNNTGIGWGAGSAITTGGGNIAIGYDAQVPNATTHYQVRIGDTNITYAGIQVAWTVTSDIRWKENIKECPLGLNFVSKLSFKEYTRKNSGKKELGVIAQEVEQVLDKIGYTDQDFLTKDDNGFFELRYQDLFVAFGKAIQELSTIVSKQQQEINQLKGL